jgi:DNA-binding transcriptional LysR family regulator
MVSGVAVIDEFTLAGDNWPNLRALEIIEPTSFQTYIAYRKDATLSSYCEHFIASLRSHMEGQADSTSERPARRATTRRASQKVTLG